MPNVGGRIVVQKHVHPRERIGGIVLLLAIDRDALWRFVGSLKKQRTGAASGVIDCMLQGGVRANADYLRHDTRDLSGRVELSLALARLGGEMTHEVLVSVAEQIVALGTVGAEIEILEYGDQLGEPILYLSAGTELALIVEVRLIDDTL